MTRFHLIMFCLVLHAEVTRSLLVVAVRLGFGFNCRNLYRIGMMWPPESPGGCPTDIPRH